MRFFARLRNWEFRQLWGCQEGVLRGGALGLEFRMVFRVEGLGFRVLGLGFRMVWGSGFWA